jgi:hypothetical protein
MQHSSYIIEGNTYSGTSPLTNLRSAGYQQTFNIRPGNIGTDRFLEDSLQSLTVF